jgi:Holliday junction resolvase RusA-like endonuclease
MHWASTSKLRAQAKDTAIILTIQAMAGKRRTDLCEEIPVVITFVQPDKRRRDRDNLLAALKPALDGIAIALSVDDSQFEPVTICRQYGAKPGAVRVQIGEVV